MNKSCSVGQFEDVSKVEKYTISDQEYGSKKGKVIG